MKICGISDIHGNLIQNIPECNVLCICGDVINLNDQRDIPASKSWWSNRFIKWVEKLKCEKVIVIPGNHDFYLEHIYNKGDWKIFAEWMSLLTNGKLVFLLDEEYEYQGIKFYGTPWIKPILFQENRWAFSSQGHFDKIPLCDVLLTHDSPYKNHILDFYSYTKSKYHLYGHWHSGENDVNRGKYNCSRLDDMYNFKKDYEFVVLEIMTEQEKKKIEQDFLDTIIERAKGITFSAGEHCVSDWLTSNFKDPVLQQDIEDEVPWMESSMISDVEN